MKYSILLLGSILLCSSCSTIKESVIDTDTSLKIAGYGKDCLFRIGETERSEIPEVQLEKLKKDSLTFLFADDPKKGKQKGKIISIGIGGKYATSKGITSGDSVQKALKAYGKPKAMIFDFGKDEEHRIHWIFHGLFYDNLAIFTDSSFTTIIGIVVGKQKEFDVDLNKRYIKKR